MLRFSDYLIDNLGFNVLEVSQLRNAATLLLDMPIVDSTHGKMHRFEREIQAPKVGFRKEYKGRFFSKSVDEPVTRDLEVIDYSWMVDMAAANRYPKAKGGRDGLVAKEGFRHLRQALFQLESQLINGVVGAGWNLYQGATDELAAGETDGFLGFADERENITTDALTGAIDHGGTDAAATDPITGLTSVYFIMEGEDHIAGIVNPENPPRIMDAVVQNVTNIVNDPDANAQGSDGGTNYTVLYTPGLIDWGVQVATRYDVLRLANIGGTAGGRVELDDDALYSMLSFLPANMRPSKCLMNRDAQEQLRRSRTTFNPSGNPAPIPETVADGIPIQVVNTISSNEALAVVAP